MTLQPPPSQSASIQFTFAQNQAGGLSLVPISENHLHHQIHNHSNPNHNHMNNNNNNSNGHQTLHDHYHQQQTNLGQQFYGGPSSAAVVNTMNQFGHHHHHHLHNNPFHHSHTHVNNSSILYQLQVILYIYFILRRFEIISNIDYFFQDTRWSCSKRF